MPIYEIKCDKCDYCEEIIVSSDKLEEILGKICEKCKKGTIVQQIGPSNFKLNGGDYYNPGFSGVKHKPRGK